jgi:DNA-directed RNA polymerase specialized sigma24 family protein
VRRLCLTYLRRARRLVVSDPEGLDTLPGHPETNGNAWPKALASLLETLPPLQAQALRWGCDGMCLREIALRQRVPPGTVKWRMCAARLRLRKFLEERPNLFDG